MPINALRLVYVLEYLLAIVAILNLWTEAGGAAHMDLISWYTKLSLTLGLATTIVFATSSAVASDRAWNVRTVVWTLVGFGFACAMGIASYYAHLHENDDSDAPETVAPVAFFHSSAPSGGLLA